MLEFLCPHCEARLRCPERLSGKESTCRKCGQRFLVPDRAAPVDDLAPEFRAVKPPPLEKSSPPTPPAAAVSEAARSVGPQGTRRALSWKNFFDWKFERYMTPWIIRFTWVLSVIWAACVIVLLAISMVSSAMPSREKPQTDFRSQTDIDALMRSLSQQEQSTGARWTWKLIGYGTAAVVSILSLMGTRVVLECLIVVFKIADTAASIDRSLKQQLARGETMGS